ncbi:MAG: choice-of-anchor Q domain-containing protein [Solirubrobacteraceae bacterium]
MRRLGGMAIGLLAMLALLALTSGSALAATSISVTETTDAPLESGASTCESTEVAKGCTLRAALELADSAIGPEITVDLPSGTFDDTLGPLEIDPGTDVTIVGKGEGVTIIDGEKLGDVFEVELGSSLTLREVTVRDGEGDTGGGIFVPELASATIEQSAIEENAAKTQGGGIYGGFGASITVKDSRIAKNKASQGGGGIYGGGSDITVGHSTITENEAGDGGGIYAEEDSEVTVDEQSKITENTAGDNGGGISGYEAFTAVEQSTIAKNKAGVYGGGIDVASGDEEISELTVGQSAIEENHAGEYGGGIASEEAYVTVEEHSTIAHNNADYHGGGIYSEGGEVTIKGSTIAANEAEYYGGGIDGQRSVITVEQSTITENNSVVSGGGGIAISREYSEDEDCELSGELTVKQSTISYNLGGADEEGNGGGIYAETSLDSCGDHVRAGASTKRASAATPRRSSSTHRVRRAVVGRPSEEGGGLTVEQSTIAHNVAGWSGGGIYERAGEDPIVNSTIADNAAGEEGGGMYVEDDDVGVLISDTFSDNTTGSDHLANNLGAEEFSTIYLRNTILAEQPGEHEQNCDGEIESLKPGDGYNLDYPSQPSTDTPSTDACGLSAEDHDLVGVEPGLAEGLQSNGGPTQTIALLSGSPAIGVVPLAEDCDEAEAGPDLVDQRGVTRPGIPGKGCDIGAYEYQEGAATTAAPKQEAKKEEAKKEVLSVKIVSPAQCASLRDITIHIQNVKQLGIVSAVVSIDGKDKRTLTGKHLRTAINLRGLPKGTFTIEIVAHTRSGRTLRGKRVYHTCHTKLPGHSYLPL